MAAKKDYAEIRAKYETKTTNANRQNRRQQQLEDAAKAAGWESWSQFVTALKNGEVEFPKAPVIRPAAEKGAA